MATGGILMLKRVRTFFESLSAGQPGVDVHESEIKMAAAVLLVEVMMADHHIDESESSKLVATIKSFLELDESAAAELIREAKLKHQELVSLYEMTRVINLHFTEQQKMSLIEHMWQIAYADQQWDKYEEHLIRKVSDLLYVSHKDFIHAKHKAQSQCDE